MESQLTGTGSHEPFRPFQERRDPEGKNEPPGPPGDATPPFSFQYHPICGLKTWALGFPIVTPVAPVTMWDKPGYTVISNW